MPRLAGKVPSYCLHRASGKAVVRINGKDHYLGPYGSPESHEAYQELIAQWRLRRAPGAIGSSQQSAACRSALPTVNEVLLAYLKFAETYYTKDGAPTKELVEMKLALRPVRQLFGRQPVREFGPLALKAVRQHMVDVQQLCRRVANNRTNRIKRFVKWAVSEELAPPHLYEALRTVGGLRFGRTNARETEPIRPVPWEWVEPVLGCVSSQVVAMIRLQWLTGMRPCEVVAMRVADLDRSSTVWVYEPADHKNRWRGHRRVIPLGPQSQSILRPFLATTTGPFVFSPRDAEAQRNRSRRESRRTPMTPSQRARKAKPQSKRAKRERYDVDSYRRAIEYGIRKVNKKRPADQQIGKWFPLQLRHSRATEIRRRYGLEAAQVALGHRHANVTEVYAERDFEAAVRIAREAG